MLPAVSVDRIPRSFSLRVRAPRQQLVESLAAHPRCRISRELRPFPPPPTGEPILLTYGKDEIRLRHYVSPWDGVEAPRLVIRLVDEDGGGMLLRARFEGPGTGGPVDARALAGMVAMLALLTAQWMLLAFALAALMLAHTLRPRLWRWLDEPAQAQLRLLWSVTNDALATHVVTPAALVGSPYRSPS